MTTYKFSYRDIEVTITETPTLGVSLVEAMKHAKEQIDAAAVGHPTLDPDQTEINWRDLPKRVPAFLDTNEVYYHGQLTALQEQPRRKWRNCGAKIQQAIIDYMIKHKLPINFPYRKSECT